MNKNEKTRVEKCEILKGLVVGNEYEAELTEFLDKLITSYQKKRVTKINDTDIEIMEMVEAVVKNAEGAIGVADIMKDEAIAAYRYDTAKDKGIALTSSKVAAAIRKLETVVKDEDASTNKTAKYKYIGE